MYQIDKPTFSVRLKDDDRDVVNELLQHIQEKEDKTYTFAKDVFMDVIEKAQTSLQPVNTTDPTDHPQLQDLIEIYRENFDIPKETSVTQVLIEALTRANEPPKEAPTVEIEKEVERKLSDNEILLNVNTDQMKVINKITSNRNKKLPEDKKEEVSDTIKNMVFNRANINNWHGAFYTGFDKIF